MKIKKCTDKQFFLAIVLNPKKEKGKVTLS